MLDDMVAVVSMKCNKPTITNKVQQKSVKNRTTKESTVQYEIQSMGFLWFMTYFSTEYGQPCQPVVTVHTAAVVVATAYTPSLPPTLVAVTAVLVVLQE